jgi:hypothetical protein
MPEVSVSAIVDYGISIGAWLTDLELMLLSAISS